MTPKPIRFPKLVRPSKTFYRVLGFDKKFVGVIGNERGGHGTDTRHRFSLWQLSRIVSGVLHLPIPKGRQMHGSPAASRGFSIQHGAAPPGRTWKPSGFD
jgi:hypothetical protein